MTKQISAMWLAVTVALVGGSIVAAEGADPPYPTLVTAETRANAAKLAALERPGEVFFQDGFESADSLNKYFEIRGLREGCVKLTTDDQLAHEGNGAIQFTSPARDGRESGVGATAWFGPDGYDRVYFRRYIKFAADYDQGNLNHVGGGLTGVSGANRWKAMGSAGIRPPGDSHFKSAFEPWRDWKRYPSPGYMFLYTYWMDMKGSRDGKYYGNMMGPAHDERLVLQRDQWYCLEHMIQSNDPGEANGELAAWIDGKLYIHYTGFRWRTTPDVKLKRFGIGVYVHNATRYSWWSGGRPPGSWPRTRRSRRKSRRCSYFSTISRRNSCDWILCE
jgi:hypothetical protein